jgi:hypothetical protein
MEIAPEKITVSREYEHMLFFSELSEAQRALQTLKSLKCKNASLFQVKSVERNPLAIDCTLKMTSPVEASLSFGNGEKSYAFLDYFEAVARITCRPISIGTIYSNAIVFPDQIDNHHFNRTLYEYLLPEVFKRQEVMEPEMFDEEEEEEALSS